MCKENSEKKTAKEWMLDFLSQEFTVKLTKGYSTWYLNGQWVFQQDFKNKILLCYYHKVWKIFEDEYSMDYQQIQAMLTETVGEALNCRDFTTTGVACALPISVGEALNCRDFTTKRQFFKYSEW